MVGFRSGLTQDYAQFKLNPSFSSIELRMFKIES